MPRVGVRVLCTCIEYRVSEIDVRAPVAAMYARFV